MQKLVKKRILRSLVLSAVLGIWFPASVWAATVMVGGTGAALGTVQILADAYVEANPGVEIEVLTSLGSGGGIRGVSTGVLDIGLSARPLKHKENRAGVSATAYAKSPFVFVTSDTVSDPRLTQEQLVAVFAADQVFWSSGSRILPILRPEADSDTVLLSGYFDGMRAAMAKARAVPGIPVAATDQDAMALTEKILGALTTATLTAVLAEGRSLVPVSIDGVAPTVANLANGTYTKSKTLYFVTGPGISKAARDFLRFIRSPAGAEILAHRERCGARCRLIAPNPSRTAKVRNLINFQG